MSQENPIVDIETLLKDLRQGVDRLALKVLPIQKGNYRQLCEWSVLRDQLEAYQHYFNGSLLLDLADQSPSLDRAMGCFLGMVVGDSVGAPLELTPAGSRQEGGRVEFDCSTCKLIYTREKNSLRLKRGQWTDDAAMGICMAESILARDGFMGGDIRVRFYLWWNFGYCNAFRHDLRRKGSVGLGGNIGQSLLELMDNHTLKNADHVPPRYEATEEDSGNGSMMRLAPVPIRYHSNVERAMNVAEESSYTTHPGSDAASCCRFMSFFICRAMRRSRNIDILTFTDQIISEFLSRTNHSNVKLRSLLRSQPPSPKEACWNWKAKCLAIEETLANRGSNYNGCPVSAEYFGSYCMDGLAMALYALVHSNTLADCILKTVNLRGDADTTAAISGQLAGAFYGYRSLQEDLCGQRMIRDLRQWDPLCEMEWRAVLLHRDGVKWD